MADLFFDQDERSQPAETSHVARKEPRRFGRWLAVFAILVVLGLVALAVGGLWVRRRIDPPGPAGEEIAFTIPNGATTSGVAELLQEEGIISDATVFTYYLRVQGGGPFQAGAYTLRESSSFGEVVDTLEEGPFLAFEDVTVPEGKWVPEVAGYVAAIERFSAQRFLELATGDTVRSRYQPVEVRVLDGLLLPETYSVDETEDEADLLARMVEDFDAAAAELGYDDAEARVGLTPYEAIVVASLVEAEAKVDDDRAKIARVIYNRIAAGMRLEIDATVYFALGRRGGGLTQTDLEVDSPYNTRRYEGMPPTPIAMPGAASLAAAINPEPGDWLFYVLADERGVHAFSSDYDQFLRDVEAARAKGLL